MIALQSSRSPPLAFWMALLGVAITYASAGYSTYELETPCRMHPRPHYSDTSSP